MGPESFVETGTVVAVIIDITRLFIYGLNFNFTQFRELDAGIGVNLVVAATL